jgi:isoleucyl-tRNA synthetase
MALPKYDFNVVEKTILAFWKDKKIYEKANAKGKGGKKFYFLDGPPYTSGRVHIATAWNKAMKDMVIRYKRLTGFDVWDRAGYDMHGLPTEHKVMAKFNLETKEQIVEFGLKKFSQECTAFSTEYAKLMSEDFKRLGVWMDFDNAYMPITKTFIEGEWWLIKTAHEKGRLYEGKKVMTWCPSCATALAKHELEYRNVTEKSIFVKFKVKGKENEYLIIWTTTPWTIPFNLAVMVNPDLEYVRAQVENEVWIVSKALAGPVIRAVADKDYKLISEFKGRDLEGLAYEHPFEDTLKPEYDKLRQKTSKLHTVVMSSEYVDISAGTGLVHCAPGCGPEDYEIGHREGIPPYNTIDQYGNFPQQMGEFAGLNAKSHGDRFIDALKKRNVLIEITEVEHDYAHCWRCHGPVVFKTTKQWFFKVEDLKDEMIELNKKVHWVPDWAGSRHFDSWLRNLRDNSITRQRFWGTPAPIWKCSQCKDFVVIGSVDELKSLSGSKVPKDLHIPYIDEVKIPCKCGGQKNRISDILDVWIDAGTNSWTCLDFPENEKYLNELFPADFILEGPDQIRGWFNVLLVCSMIAFEKHPYKACYMHGMLTDIEGEKMSKSLGNIISPYEVIDKYGADTLRYYFIGGNEAGEQMNFSWEECELKFKNMFVLWNIQNFLLDLCRTNNINPKKLGTLEEELFGLEERYIISRLHDTIFRVTNNMEIYRIENVPRLLESLYLDISRTYIQLVRDKAAGEKGDKDIVAYCLYTCLLAFIRMFQIVSPFISEMIYQNLKDEFGLKEASVALCEWPKHDTRKIDNQLEVEMVIAKDIMQSVFYARDKAGIGRRWPLSEIAVVTKDEITVNAVEKMADLIKSQTNVKSVNVQQTFPYEEVKVKADYDKIGPEFGNLAPQIIAKLATDSSETILGHIEKEGKYTFTVGNKQVDIKREHLIFEQKTKYPYIGIEFGKGKVYINQERTPELDAEGFAREITRQVQSERKKAGLEKKDEIMLFIKVSSGLANMLKDWERKISERVGASNIAISDHEPGKKHDFGSKLKVKKEEIEIYFDKI